MTDDTKQHIRLSVIVPAYNEEHSIAELSTRLKEVLQETVPDAFEIIFIDDGSTDNSWETMCSLSDTHDTIRALKFRTNFGKAAAIESGIAYAAGEIVVIMDADLQDDPKEIPRMLEKLEEGYDLVNGWKQIRNDPLEKTIPSKIFNWVVAKVSGLELHDFNCGYKMFYRKIFDSVALYGEMHRYIPVLAYYNGYKVTEIPVEHHARKHGKSKYGVTRYIRGVLDLYTVMVTTRYAKRPGHIFGVMGIVLGLTSGLILTYLTGVWLFTDDPIGTRPLLLFGLVSLVISAQLIFFSLIAEFILCRSELKGSVRIISKEHNF